MRIRKCASKLLELARAHPPSSSPSPPPPPVCSPLHATTPPPPPVKTWEPVASTSAGAPEVLFCQLNCSPWDVMATLHLLQGEEEEGVGGIPGNGIKLEEGSKDQQPMSPRLSKSNLMNERKKKPKQKKKRRKGEVVTETRRLATPKTVITCKKSDRNGWHCKRLVKHPHTQCHCRRHLHQLRSYSCTGSTTDVTGDGDGSSSRCRRRKTDAGKVDASVCYYYYSGFGPPRRKPRGGSYTGNGRSEENSDFSDKRNDDDDDDNDDPVADDDKGSIDEVNGIVYDEVIDSRKEESDSDNVKNTMYRKRRRKPVKARSLKSLL